MDRQYKDFRRELKKHMCKPSVCDLCRQAGFSDRETSMVVMFFCDGQSEDFVADTMNMSRSAYHENKMILVSKLQDYCKRMRQTIPTQREE